MRYPLNSITVTNPFGQPGYGVFGKHAGVDLRAAIGTNVYAPANGVITESYVGSKGIQVLSMRIGNYEHRFLHLSQRLVPVGAQVKEGQVIAKSGNSGGVATHLHWDVRKAGTAWNRSFSDYVDPLSLISKGEAPMNSGDVTNLYRALLGRDPDPAGLATYVGKTWHDGFYGITSSREYQTRQGIINSQLAGYNQLAAQVAELSSRPTKAELQAVLDSLNTTRNKVAELEKQLETEKAQKSEDTELLNQTGNWLSRLFNRLFKKG